MSRFVNNKLQIKDDHRGRFWSFSALMHVVTGCAETKIDINSASCGGVY